MKFPSSYVELPDRANPGLGIEAVWASVAEGSGHHRVLPDGRCDIILRFCATAGPISDLTVVVTGPTTRHRDVPVEPGVGFAGIRIRPSYFQAVLGLKPGLLRDRNLVGEAAIKACPSLSELCGKADSLDELPDRLVAFVRRRVALGRSLPSARTRQLLSALHASSGRLTVQDVARMHGLTVRTVQRILFDATGLSPKPYARILQFHRALRLLRDHRLSPSDTAFEAGYADQSHMARAFRELGGLSPARLSDVTLVTISE